MEDQHIRLHYVIVSVLKLAGNIHPSDTSILQGHD